jgi:hypothetical protein
VGGGDSRIEEGIGGNVVAAAFSTLCFFTAGCADGGASSTSSALLASGFFEWVRSASKSEQYLFPEPCSFVVCQEEKNRWKECVLLLQTYFFAMKGS